MAILSLILAAAAVVADQFIKRLVVTQLRPVGSVSVIPGLLDFTYVENRGAAFGMLQDQRWFFLIATALLSIVIVFLLFRYTRHSFFSIASSILLLGGGIGNMIDRMVNGYVVDYIHVSFFPFVFNFADCCVTVGTILFLIHVLFFEKGEDRVEKVERNH